jgi:iron complex outermembrane recepter protein
LIATAAYTDARLRDDTVPVGGGLNLTGGLEGDRLPFTPEFTGNLSVDYDWSIGDAEAFVGGSYRFVSDQKGGFSTAYRTAFGRRIELDDYATVDLRAGVDFGRFRVQAYVRNLFDSYAVVSAGGFPFAVPPALGGTNVQLINVGTLRPRTIGFIVGAEF